jgi:hypothetical protein
LDTRLTPIAFSTSPELGSGRSTPPPAKGRLATTLGTRAFFQRRSEPLTPFPTVESYHLLVVLCSKDHLLKNNRWRAALLRPKGRLRVFRHFCSIRLFGMKPGYGFREEKKDYLSVQFIYPVNPA